MHRYFFTFIQFTNAPTISEVVRAQTMRTLISLITHKLNVGKSNIFDEYVKYEVKLVVCRRQGRTCH